MLTVHEITEELRPTEAFKWQASALELIQEQAEAYLLSTLER
jgi:histone H3/H4